MADSSSVSKGCLEYIFPNSWKSSCLNLALRPSLSIQMQRHHRKSSGRIEEKDCTSYSRNKLDVIAEEGRDAARQLKKPS